MGIQGGDDRSLLRPLRPDGNVDHDLAGRHIVGNHKGDSAAYNIVDPRPGTVHEYAKPEDVLGCRQRGWWVADPEVDGRPAYELMDQYVSDAGTRLGRGDAYKGLVHMVTSEENFARLMAETAERAREALAPAGQAFLDRVAPDEYETGRTAEGRHRPTRFATRDHGIYLVEGEQQREVIRPRGILREEVV